MTRLSTREEGPLNRRRDRTEPGSSEMRDFYCNHAKREKNLGTTVDVELESSGLSWRGKRDAEDPSTKDGGNMLIPL